MDSLTDQKAVELAELLRLYYEDCHAEDPDADGPAAMTVLDLLQDLETSTADSDAERISARISAILDLGLRG